MRQSKIGECYEYLCSCVDDLSFAVDDPNRLIKELTEGPFYFKLKGTGPLKFHLGCGFGRDIDKTLHLDPKQCIEKILDTAKDMCLGSCQRRRMLL